MLGARHRAAKRWLGTSSSIYACPVSVEKNERLPIDESVPLTLLKMLFVVPCIRIIFFAVKLQGIRALASTTGYAVRRRFGECFRVPDPVGLFVCGYSFVVVSSTWTAMVFGFGKK